MGATDWFLKSYSKANEEVPYSVQDPGLTSDHIKEFTHYTDTLLKPRETKAQIAMAISLSVGSTLGILICVFILSDGLGYRKFDSGLKTGSFSTITAILGFLAGSQAGKKT
jgi:hypothetical protein